MTLVLEEKIPFIGRSLVQQYGEIGQSAVDAVSEGIKKAISQGIAANTHDEIQSVPNQAEKTILGLPSEIRSVLGKFEANAVPIIGQKISNAASFHLPQKLQNQFKGSEKAQNAELTAFAKNVFGKDGLFESARAIIIQGKLNQAERTNQAEASNPGEEKGIVGPEYFVFKNMEATLKKTLSMSEALVKVKMAIRG